MTKQLAGPTTTKRSKQPASDKKAEYLAKFKTFSPEKQRRHLVIVTAYAIWLLQGNSAETFPLSVPPQQLGPPKESAT